MVVVPSQKQALRQAVHLLADLLDVPAPKVRVRSAAKAPEIDVIADVGRFRFVIEWKSSGAVGPVSAAVDQVRRYAARFGNRAIPLVAVPYMGEAGRRRCEAAHVAWLDLSGNGRIIAPGLRILIEGKPNRFKRRGRPLSAFAPKSSRIARWLLMHPAQPISQRDLARATDMDEGFTSRIVAKLEEDGLIVREPDGAIRARDPNLLLDAWRDEYDFSKHSILRGHVAARSGDALLRQLADALRGQKVDYAATGLAAAWLLTRFASFRIVMIYLRDKPEASFLESISFRDDPRGANLWFVIPNDEGVFHGASDHDGIRCAHAVQVYLDLKDQPERAEEAAERVRTELLKWRTDA